MDLFKNCLTFLSDIITCALQLFVHCNCLCIAHVFKYTKVSISVESTLLALSDKGALYDLPFDLYFDVF